MLRNAYLARTSAATIALVACVYLMMSDTRAEAATGASESQKESTLIRIWHALFRSDSAENQADTLFADEPAEKEPADNTTDTEASIRSSVDGKGDLFRSDPQYKTDYNALRQIDVYGGKSVVDPPRPLLELGRLQYTSGKYDESSTLLGKKNPLLPGLSIYGDWRTAIAYNNNKNKDIAQIATRLNLDVDFKITGTERIHAFFTPLQKNNQFTRYEFGGNDADGKFNGEFDPEPQTLFLEGDFGSLYSGFSGQEASFDLPFTAGLFPLFLQNGIWANDAILGGAVSIPAKNSKVLGLANFDVTFFAAFNDVDNQGIIGADADDNNNTNLYGATAFIDAFDGYIETGYGLIQGRDDQDGLLTHFLTGAYTRRYHNTLSNSTRVFANFGEDPQGKSDGVAFISENSLISGLPSTLLPYANFFVGFGNPQPLVDGNGAGILKNVGINFETDALTGYPKLDDTGSNAWGGAIGLQYLFDLDEQLAFEVAMVQPFEDDGIGAKDAQYGFGVRYKIPIDQAWLFRADATYQILEGADEDNFGVRAELRRKF
ncbi:MAG: hypothetical protein WCE69_11825 [Aestuariivirga sp.]